MKLTVTVEAADLGDALSYLRSWAEDTQQIAYSSSTPVKAEWKSASKDEAVSLQAWMEA